MRPVDQRYWRPECREVGDCFAACVASILELDLDLVPHFMKIALEQKPEWGWWTPMNAFLWEVGLTVNFDRYMRGGRQVWAPKPRRWHPGWWIAMVQSRSTDPTTTRESAHAVVMWSNEVRHDPNPESRAVKRPYRFGGETWFEAFDPATLLATAP